MISLSKPSTSPTSAAGVSPCRGAEGHETATNGQQANTPAALLGRQPGETERDWTLRFLRAVRIEVERDLATNTARPVTA